MRIGFSVKELAEILGIDPRRVGQSVDPAMEKLARLWMRNPTKTMEFLLDTVHTLQRIRLNAVAPMPEDEIEDRIKIATGRMNQRALIASDISTGRTAHPNELRI